MAPGTLGLLSNYSFSVMYGDWTTVPRQQHTDTVKHRTVSKEFTSL